MNKVVLYTMIYIVGIIISSIAQILLKKSADTKKENIIKEYLNVKTIVAYLIFFGATWSKGSNADKLEQLSIIFFKAFLALSFKSSDELGSI